MPHHLQNLEELRQLHDLHHMEAIHGPGAQGPALASLVKPLLGLALVGGSWLGTLGLGLDEAGRDNHARVKEVHLALENRGWRTWFDEQGDMRTAQVFKSIARAEHLAFRDQ